MSYTTPTMVKEELRATVDFSSTTTPSLTTVKRWIEEESRIIDAVSHTSYDPLSVEDVYLDYDGSGMLRLPSSPILALTLQYNTNGVDDIPAWVTLQEGEGYNYLLYKDEGEVEFLKGNNATNKPSYTEGKKKFKIAVTYGYESIPGEIQRLATLLVSKRAITSLASSQANSEGGDVQIGSIRVSDPSNYSMTYIKSMDLDIKELYNSIISQYNTFRITRVY